MSLTSILNAEQKPLFPVLDVNDYNWTPFNYSHREIRAYHVAHIKQDDVIFNTWPRENDSKSYEERMYWYGDRPQEYSECWRYTDGTVLVALVVSTFAGTFASQDDIETRYYLATPK